MRETDYLGNVTLAIAPSAGTKGIVRWKHALGSSTTAPPVTCTGSQGLCPRERRQAGADVRLRHVEELASELMISQNQYWGRHRSQVAEAPLATLDDLEWADGIAFGSPTRFGNVAAQLSSSWTRPGGCGRRGSSRTRSRPPSPPHRRPTAARNRRSSPSTTRSTTGACSILPLGYTVKEVFAAGGNPYGTSFTSGHTVTGPLRAGARSCPLPGTTARSVHVSNRRGPSRTPVRLQATGPAELPQHPERGAVTTIR